MPEGVLSNMFLVLQGFFFLLIKLHQLSFKILFLANSFHTFILIPFTLNPSFQENFQSGRYVADSGEDEGRAGFSQVTQLYSHFIFYYLIVLRIIN